jgi:uncharacterized protein involved in tolerance to divalent cations
MDPTEFILVFSSAGSQIEASKIAETLIESKLAACVSILPGVTSHYCWDKKKESSYEVLMIIKALKKNFESLKSTIKDLHSFETPEILMLPVIGGSEDYLNWMKAAAEGACSKEE